MAKGSSEMELKNVKCFGCHQKGHVISDCPERKAKKPSRVIQTEQTIVSSAETSGVDLWNQPVVSSQTELPNSQETSGPQEPWMCVLTASTEDDSGDGQSAKLVGPTFKVSVDIEGVKTRALLDNGSQVTLVRGELLARIRAQNNWTLEQCHEKNRPMDAQPVGASGQELGATSVVAIGASLGHTGQSVTVPCFVVTSDKPIWQGALQDCAVVLGTNAMVKFGIQTVLSDGSVVTPTGDTPSGHVANPPARGVFLVRAGYVAPRQSRMVEVSIPQVDQDNLDAGVLTPSENMANMMCDFPEILWAGATKAVIAINNWGPEPVTLAKGQQVGRVEPAVIVPEDDPVWEDSSVQVLLCQDKNDPARLQKLQKQLQFGEQLAIAEQEQLCQMLLSQSDVFALSDEELGETELVTHDIDTGDARPVRAMPRRLPYAVRKELEDELKQLLDIGCIEPSNSSYASPLVLVRKKNGNLRVCVDYRNVNKDTVPDRYPIPRIDELVDMVGRNRPKIFSSLDLMRGYHQVRMAEDAKHKTAFTCHLGLFQYRRMPFGLTNVPATFQQLMSQLFSGQEWSYVFVYLDDILIASKTLSEHVEHVQRAMI